jgi:hypothetical protein
MKMDEKKFYYIIYNIITIYLVRKQTKAVTQAKNNCITA